MSKTFDFQKQLSIGKKGEELFLKRYPDLTPTDGRKGDFIGYSKRVIELKTDSYDMNKTPNFFMERWSNIENEKPGGVWQSAGHGAYYYCYLFEKHGVIYWFEVKALLEHLEANEKLYKKMRINNKGWLTEGWLVPRATLEALIILKENVIPLQDRELKNEAVSSK